MTKEQFFKWNIITNVCMALIHVGFVPGILGIWMETYVQLHIVGLLTSLIIEKPVAWLALKL